MNNYLSPLDILTLFTRETAQDSHMRDFYEIPSPINLRYNCRSAAYIAEGCLYIVAEMPGLSPGDFTLEVKDNIVTLLGDVNSKFKKYESHVKAAPKNVG